MEARYQARLPTPRYYLDLISCRSACPVRTDAGAYVRAVANGDYEAGYATAASPNPWVSVCARVCAHPCESSCRRGTVDQPISIRALKRTLTERHGAERAGPGAVPQPPRLGVAATGVDGPARVAVVGAGPAGLACAHDLAYLGYEVTVFEASPVAGGMLAQGIPEYRLTRDVIRAEVDRTVRLGVEIRTGQQLGKDFTMADLRRRGYAAFFLAFGATRGRDLAIPGAELDGIINGVDFLLNANLGYRVDVGDHVVVVGGGNVAIDVARTVLRYAAEPEASVPPAAQTLIESWGYDHSVLDAARTALRLGARQVTVVSLERRHEMPASAEEIREAEEEGIRFEPGRGPARFVGDEGRVMALETRDVASVFDETGRFNPSFVTGSERRVACDTVILAIGQTPDLSALSGDAEIAVTPRGLVQVDPHTLQTSVPDVFCGGDLAFGPRIVIDAAGDGKRAALAIHEYLGGRPLHRSPMRFRSVASGRWMDDYDRLPRQPVPCLPVQRRAGFREVELDYQEADARTEGRRCLQCNVSPVFDSDRCILCGGCVDICPEDCLKMVRADRLAGVDGLETLQTALGAGPGAGAILKDEERCIRCALCVDRCPTGAVTMELLEIDESPASTLALFAEERSNPR